ncbi:ABC transporter ATP-binding protein [Trinickia mobilis]|uniref:ABC transporter ATP-binding protein n=1 Tax=Trinickia mobilis TaxID=2816356 RepID=UPI001A8EE255|nr:ABC transporter ATP-binding protein [Trinickia mobilis]
MDMYINLKDLTKAYPLARSESGEMLERMLVGGSDSEPTSTVGQKIAVDHVNLHIAHGERVGIIGRNGAGKSTLLHMIAGLSEPTSGTIDIQGKVTAIMTLGVGLREHATGRENIYIDGEIQGKSRAEIDAVVDQIVDFAELGEFIDLPVRTYSTGMKSRLSFAMISYIEPEILIIDEALSAGDERFGKKASAKIQEICNAGKIVILVSHSVKTINDMCDRCLWIDQGRVVMDGPPEVVTKAYLDAVRGEDEARLLERFKRELHNFSVDPGWQVDLLHTTHDDDTDRALLMAGQPASIRMQFAVADCNDTTQVCCSITRLDGTLMLERTVAAYAYCRDGKIRLALGMASIVLGQGVYRFDASVCHQGETKTSSCKIFEIYTLNPPTGGKPMLLYPSRVRARSIA